MQYIEPDYESFAVPVTHLALWYFLALEGIPSIKNALFPLQFR